MGVEAEIIGTTGNGLRLLVGGTTVQLEFNSFAWINRYEIEIDGCEKFYLGSGEDVEAVIRRIADRDERFLALIHLIDLVSSTDARRDLLRRAAHGIGLSDVMKRVVRSLSQQIRHHPHILSMARGLLKGCRGTFPDEEVDRWLGEMERLEVRAVAHALKFWRITHR